MKDGVILDEVNFYAYGYSIYAVFKNHLTEGNILFAKRYYILGNK